MLPMLVVGWQASALRGEEAGRFREVACVSIIDVGGPRRGRHFNTRQPSDITNLISIFWLDESSSWGERVWGGACAWDKNTSARLCAKEQGGEGGLCVRGAYLWDNYSTTLLSLSHATPVQYYGFTVAKISWGISQGSSVPSTKPSKPCSMNGKQRTILGIQYSAIWQPISLSMGLFYQVGELQQQMALYTN